MAYVTVKDKRYQLSRENLKVLIARSITNFIIFAFIQVDAMLKKNLKHNKVEFTDEELNKILRRFSKYEVISYNGNVVADVNRKKLATLLKIPTAF